MKEIAHAERAHAVYSASGASRWLACPGSIKLGDLCEDPPSSRYAEEGTAAHEVLEAYLTGSPSPKLFGGAIEVTQAMHDHAIEARAWILEEKGDNELRAETRVRLDFIRPAMFGTVDAAIIELYGTLTVIDYKYGAGVRVHPRDNAQLLYYALGLAHEYDYQFEKVRLVIIQPRCQPRPVEWTCTMDYLLEFRGRLEKGVEACEEESPSFHVGDHCRWCRAKDICTETSPQVKALGESLSSTPEQRAKWDWAYDPLRDPRFKPTIKTYRSKKNGKRS